MLGIFRSVGINLGSALPILDGKGGAMIRLTFIIVAALLAEPALASKGSGFGEYCPTFFLDTSFGLTTYKSKLVESNDTGTGLSYALGGYAGEDRKFGFLVKTDTSTTSFLLNTSKVAVSWQDSILRYRLGPVYAGLLLTTIDLKVNNQGVDELDVSGSGTGGNLGFFYPIGRMGLFYFDASTVTLTNFRNVLADEVKGGTRLDLDMGAYFDLTRDFLDLAIGYRQRTTSFKVTSSYDETFYVTYVGFRTAIYF